MPIILEELKIRLAAAQARHANAQARLQATQGEFNAATQNLNVWANAVNIEAAEEAARASEAAKDQMPINLQMPTSSVAEAAANEDSSTDEEPINKTEFVRDLIRVSQGITSDAIWKAFHQAAPNGSKNYLYSVLKRLRDKDEISQRRGKYFLKAKPAIASSEETDDKRELFMN